MKNLIVIILLFLSAFVFGQGAGITQRSGVPNFTPTNQQSNFYLDQSSKKLYEYCPSCTGNTNGWVEYTRIDRIAGTVAPAYTPNSFDAKIVVNGTGSIYTWNGTTWVATGKVTFYPFATGGKTTFKLLEGDYKSNPSAAPTTAEIGEFAVKADTDNPGVSVEPEFISPSSIVAKVGLDSNYVKNLTKAKLAINGNNLSIVGSNTVTLPTANSWNTGGNTLTTGLEILGSNSPNYPLRIKANNLEVGRFYSDLTSRYFLADNGKPFRLQHLNGSSTGNDMYIQSGNSTSSGGDLYLLGGVKNSSGVFGSNIFFGTGNGSSMNTQAMRLFGENLGIGLSGDVPTQNLDVAGTIRIRGTNPGAGKILTSDANGVASWQTPTTYGTISRSGQFITLSNGSQIRPPLLHSQCISFVEKTYTTDEYQTVEFVLAFGNYDILTYSNGVADIQFNYTSVPQTYNVTGNFQNVTMRCKAEISSNPSPPFIKPRYFCLNFIPK